MLRRPISKGGPSYHADEILLAAHLSDSDVPARVLEHNIANYGNYNVFLDHKLDFRGDQLFLLDRPGLGVDLDEAVVEKYLVR